jgi:bifunctional enzyme CysN/CysC/sulfate adenylyltransferase subunit 1
MSLAAAIEHKESFASFLERELNKDLLRFTTAGSVDDGKSTLIGRLLHDSKAVYEDQLASVKKSRVNRSGKEIDFSLLTDGLRAEREQGITIDVAYRYFSTARRKFIIADTPGHEQYTRNMATGASTADLAVILVDGTKGLLPQTRRHAYIASLLGIPAIVAAINKMDLVDYREDVFATLERDFRTLARSLGALSVHCIPVSALEGDNIVTRSENMPWYPGPTLMEHLETVEIRRAEDSGDFRFPVQSVIRPDASFRGFAGWAVSGTIRPGDSVLALPSLRRSKVKAIVTYHGEISVAIPQQSVVLQLEDEIDLSRGDLLVAPDALPSVSEHFAAMVVWLHAEPLQLNRTYLLKQSVRQLRVKSQRMRRRVNINDFSEHPARQLDMNEIASVEFEASSPLFFEPYSQSRAMGSFILIDPQSNLTVGAGMIQEGMESFKPDSIERMSPSGAWLGAAVTRRERSERHGHLPAVFLVDGGLEIVNRLERALFQNNFEVLLLQQELVAESALPNLLSTLLNAGLIVIYAAKAASDQERAILKAAAGDCFVEITGSRVLDVSEIEIRILSIASTLRANFRYEEDANRHG